MVIRPRFIEKAIGKNSEIADVDIGRMVCAGEDTYSAPAVMVKSTMLKWILPNLISDFTPRLHS